MPQLTRRRLARLTQHRMLRYAALLAIVVLVCGSDLFNDATRFIGALVAVNVIAGLGLVVMYGWTGLLSVAQGALVGTAAYTFAILVGHRQNSWLSLIGGIVLATLGGALLGLVATRIRSHYFVLATLAIAEVIMLVLDNQLSLTGGDNGMVAPNHLDLGVWEVTSPKAFFVLASVVAVIAMYVCASLKPAALGVSMRTLNANEILGLASGVSPAKTRLIASSTAGFFAGIAGVLYAPVTGFLGPSNFNLAEALVLLVGVVLGGMESVPGAAIGVCATSYLAFGVPSLGVKGPLVYGVGVIAVLVVTPGGLAAAATWGRRGIMRWKGTSARASVVTPT